MGWERLGQKQVLGGLSGVWVQTGELRDAWYPKRRGQAGLGPPSCLRHKLLAGDAAVGELGALHELRWEKAAGRLTLWCPSIYRRGAGRTRQRTQGKEEPQEWN